MTDRLLIAAALDQPLAHPPLVLPLDLDDRLEENRLALAERRRLDYRAVWRLVLGRSRLKDDGPTFVTPNAPQSPSTSYEHADRKLGGVPSELDVPVGKTEPEDPFRAAVPSSHEYFSFALPDVGGRTLASHVSCSFLNELDPHDHRLSVRCGRDSPQLASTTDRVADGRRSVLPRGIDLEAAVRVDDFETPPRHECGMPSYGNPKTRVTGAVT